MALADPQSVTIGAATTPLPRTSVGTNGSIYNSADGTVRVEVSHTYGRRTRRIVKVTLSKITTDPLITGQNVRVSMSAHTVLDVPPAGFTATEMKDILLSPGTWLAAASAANAVKLVGGEN